MNCVKCGVGADCTDGTGQWWCKSDFPYVKVPSGIKEPYVTCAECSGSGWKYTEDESNPRRCSCNPERK